MAHCTSISTNKEPNNSRKVSNQDNDGPYHLRNMDWDLEVAKCLCDVTIDVDFQKNGVNLFRMTTWVGMIGCLTGMRFNDNHNTGWSISLNYRKTDETLGMLKNIGAGMINYHAIEFLMRKVLELEPNFEDAVKKLSTEKIMAPCYLTITGSKQNEGVLLTRKRKGEIKRLGLNICPSSDNDSRFIIQTNIDHWKNEVDPNWAGKDVLLLNSVERREVATKNIMSFGLQEEEEEEVKSNSDLDAEMLSNKETQYFARFAFHLMSQYPTCNAETIYQNVMRPATNFYQTRVVYNPPSSYISNASEKIRESNV